MHYTTNRIIKKIIEISLIQKAFCEVALFGSATSITICPSDVTPWERTLLLAYHLTATK